MLASKLIPNRASVQNEWFLNIKRYTTALQATAPAEKEKNKSSSLYDILSDKISCVVKDGDREVKVDCRKKFAFFIDKDFEKLVKRQETGLRHLPSMTSQPVSALPARINKAINIIFQEYDKRAIKKQAKNLVNKITHRKPPFDRQEIKIRMQRIYEDVVSRSDLALSHLAVLESDRLAILSKYEAKVKADALHELGNSRPFDFDNELNCLAYLYTRASYDYASVKKAFYQLKLKLPDFVPTTVLDFGSGVGTVSWALDDIWPGYCDEVVNVDTSNFMNTLNERLQRGGVMDGPLVRRQQRTHFRHFLPTSSAVKYELVVSSRSLFEMPTADTRLRVLELLWKAVAPGGCLLLVEDGRNHSLNIMLEARQFVLDLPASPNCKKARVVAPCPHQFACPQLSKVSKKRYCADFVRFISTEDKMDKKATTSLFTYMSFHKPLHNETCEYNEKCPIASHWPRLIKLHCKNSGNNIWETCTHFGENQELHVSRQKHGPACFTVSRLSNIGDFLPVTLLPPDQHIEGEANVFKTILAFTSLRNKQFKDGVENPVTIQEFLQNEENESDSQEISADSSE